MSPAGPEILSKGILGELLLVFLCPPPLENTGDRVWVKPDDWGSLQCFCRCFLSGGWVISVLNPALPGGASPATLEWGTAAVQPCALPMPVLTSTWADG